MKITFRLNHWIIPNCRITFNSLLAFLLLANLALSFSGCEMPAMPWDPPKKQEPKKEEADPKAGEESEAEEPKGPPDETDLLPEPMRKLPYEEVTITLPDQLLLYGRLYDPGMTERGENEFPDAETYKGAKYPLIILIHGLNHTHTAWSDLPATLVKSGYAVFALDLRGHGKSSITTWKRRASWRFFKPEQWKDLYKDIGQVITFFKKGEDYPEIDGSQIGLVGEKLGANVATYVAKYNPEVKALVLMSPGLEYKGIDASRGLLDYENSTLIMSNQDIKESHNQARHLYNWITGPKTLQVYEKIGEGADMLIYQPTIGNQIRDWLLQPIHPVGGPAAPESVTTDEAAVDASHAPPEDATIETGHNSEAAKQDAQKSMNQATKTTIADTKSTKPHKTEAVKPHPESKAASGHATH